MIRLEMKIYNPILTEKKYKKVSALIAAKISALSSEKIDKYEYFTGEEILLLKRVKTKTIQDQDENQMKAIADSKKTQLNNKMLRHLLLSKERERFKNIDKTDELSKKLVRVT